MKQLKSIILFTCAIIINSCSSETTNVVLKEPEIKLDKIDFLDKFREVDQLFASLSTVSQKFSVSSKMDTTIVGENGTKISLVQDQLETIGGGSFEGLIEIELLELMDIPSMLLQNAPTVSNGELLTTGGAYYLNMTSDGTQLKVKDGKGVKVEFPILTADKMSVFSGERDRFGVLNWESTQEELTLKIAQAKEPYIESAIVIEEDFEPEFEYDSIYREGILSDEEAKIQLKAAKFQQKIYNWINVLNFGWINVDEFYKSRDPRSSIRLIVENDSIESIRFYVVFEELQSFMGENYWKGRAKEVKFSNIPVNMNLQIIGVGVKKETPYIFQTRVNSSTDKKIKVNLKATTLEEIRGILVNLK